MEFLYQQAVLLKLLPCQCFVICKDINAETRNGVKTRQFLNFVKPGFLSKEQGKLYSHLFDWRQESDYAYFIEFDHSIAEPLIGEVD